MVHIGGEYVVSIDDIVMILDNEKAVRNRETSLFLKKWTEKENIFQMQEEKCESIVLTENNGKRKAYYSSIKSSTLWKRSIKIMEKGRGE